MSVIYTVIDCEVAHDAETEAPQHDTGDRLLACVFRTDQVEEWQEPRIHGEEWRQEIGHSVPGPWKRRVVAP